MALHPSRFDPGAARKAGEDTRKEAQIRLIADKCNELVELFHSFELAELLHPVGPGRALSIAAGKAEEALFWARKHFAAGASK